MVAGYVTVLALINLKISKYKSTTDQELQHIQRANDVTRTRRASGQPADAAVYAAMSGGRTSIAAILKKVVI